MANRSGQAYGLTVLSPIVRDLDRVPPHEVELRQYLAGLGRGAGSPLARVPGTHFGRWVVIDDVFYENHPSREEHLRSKYLLFTSNFDGELDAYLRGLAGGMAEEADAIWSHCVAYPGARDPAAFCQYIKRCQVETSHFFADYPDFTLERVLRSLDVQRRFVDFLIGSQGMDGAALKTRFYEFVEQIEGLPTPSPGSL